MQENNMNFKIENGNCNGNNVLSCAMPQYKSILDMGGYIVYLTHTYTKEQIAHIKEYFGWDVTNLEEK